MRRMLGIALAVGLVVALVMTNAGAATNQTSTTGERFGVKQKLRVDYNLGTCHDTQKIQLVVISTKYTRSVRSREVSVSHVAGVGDGRKCNGDGFNGSNRTVDVHPKFGCGGRCRRNTTEALGFTTGWPYVLNNGDPPF